MVENGHGLVWPRGSEEGCLAVRSVIRRVPGVGKLEILELVDKFAQELELSV